MRNLKDIRWWTFVLLGIGAVMTMLATGYFLGQRGMSVERADFKKERETWTAERKGYIERFPVVRKESYDAGVASSAAKIAALQKQIDDFGDMKAMVADAHEIVAYTLRFLGKRAEITDARAAALLKQSKTAAAAAVEAKQSLDKVDKKLTEQAVKVDAAASAVQSVEKKLAPASTPAPAGKGWFGFGGH